MDTLSKAERSANMALIRWRDTKPEMAVRRTAHRLGYRFRLHRRDLPGRPDLVFPSRKAVIFVHGCFWHQHKGCGGGRMPKARRAYWQAKLGGNVARDQKTRRKLRLLGWRVLVIWECKTRDVEGVERRITAFLEA